MTLSADLLGKEAVDSLKAMFVFAGINPDAPQDLRSQFKLSVCPLGQPDQLTSVVSDVVTGLDTLTSFKLEMDRQPIPTVRCSFSNDLPAAAPTPAGHTASTLEYQATYLPGSELDRYFNLLEAEGFEKVAPLFHGAIYGHCAEPDAADSVAGDTFGQCAAIWLNGVILAGLQFSGPGANSVDVVPMLAGMIEPIVTSLANTDPASVGLASPTTTP